MPDLYPVFDVPIIDDTSQEPKNKQKSSIYFDFEKGDFALGAGGNLITSSPYDAWVQWCLKTVNTQRWSCLGYSDQVGIEAIEAFGEISRKAQESAFTITITEALFSDPYERTKYVRDFIFNWEVDGLEVTFTVGGVWDKDATLTAKI